MAGIPRPFEGRYAPTLANALIALIPFLLVSSGEGFFQKPIAAGLRVEESGVELAAALSSGAYAFGALLGGDLVNRLRQRHLFLAGMSAATAAWTLQALAPSLAVFALGRVLAGFATGVLLVVALPPTLRLFAPERAPLTAGFVNLGLFGAIAAGPLVGAPVGDAGVWRALFGVLALVAAGNLALAVLTLPDQPPFKPDLKVDGPALALGLAATALPFSAAAALASKPFDSPVVAAPLGVGMIALAALLTVEYRAKEPLAPVKPMASTLPLIGVIAATLGGGVFLSLMRLVGAELQSVSHVDPLAAGLSFWPQTLAALALSAAFVLVLKTRFLSLFILAGLALIGVAALLLVQPGSLDSPVRRDIALALLGGGAGAAVSPGLFLAALSLPSNILGRVLALVELVRSVGDFIMGPVLERVAKTAGGGRATTPGLQLSVLAAVAIEAAAIFVCLALLLAGGEDRRRPDFVAWIKQNAPALGSRPLLARLRGRVRDP